MGGAFSTSIGPLLPKVQHSTMLYGGWAQYRTILYNIIIKKHNSTLPYDTLQYTTEKNQIKFYSQIFDYSR